jgi:hypothetical protein
MLLSRLRNTEFCLLKWKEMPDPRRPWSLENKPPKNGQSWLWKRLWKKGCYSGGRSSYRYHGLLCPCCSDGLLTSGHICLSGPKVTDHKARFVLVLLVFWEHRLCTLASSMASGFNRLPLQVFPAMSLSIPACLTLSLTQLPLLPPTPQTIQASQASRIKVKTLRKERS